MHEMLKPWDTTYQGDLEGLTGMDLKVMMLL